MNGEATGVLLVGGLSRRFGSVKALAPLGEEMLAERAWRILGEAFAERLAVGKGADQLGLTFPVLDDGVTVRTPLAGVIAGLRAAPTEVAVFLPVDCPLVTADVLRALAEACADAAIPEAAPLPGAYAQSALPVLDRRLEAGRLALDEALAELDVRTVELDPDLLANVNTERDLDRLRSLVRG
jgi:molybdopterin-guanine dinucleotide biosynthesis protein A